MQQGAASNAINNIAQSVCITGGRFVHTRVLAFLDNHFVTTTSLVAAYCMSSFLKTRVAYTWTPILHVARDVLAVAAARGIMRYLTSLQTKAGERDLPVFIIGFSVVAGAGLLARVSDAAIPVFTGVQYAFADLVHLTSIFQGRKTRVTLGSSLLILCWVYMQQDTLHSEAGGVKVSFVSTLKLVIVSYFAVYVLIPAQDGSPFDDVISGLIATLGAHALMTVLSETRGIISPYVVSVLAQRISNSISVFYDVPWWIIVVYDALLYACLFQIKTTTAAAAGAMQLVRDVLAMVAVSQVLGQDSLGGALRPLSRFSITMISL